MCLYQHLPAAHSLSKMHISGKENKESCKPVQSLHNQIWTLLGPVLATMKRLEKENNVMIAEINMSKKKRLPPIKDTGTFEGTGMIVSLNQIELRTLVVVKLNLWMF